MKTVKRIVLFDTIIDGHHADYLTHLITYWLDYQPADELLVVAQASFEPVFQGLVAQRPGAAPTLRFVPLPQAEIDAVHGVSPVKRSFREWNLQLRYIRTYQPTHVLLMYFDIFQLGILLGRKAPCAISGIYFRPDFHYGRQPGLKARLNGWRKKLTLTAIFRRHVLTNLFCLDHSAVAALNRLSTGTSVIPLPDPVKTYALEPDETDELRRTLRIEPGRQVFLLFGYLDERKGIEPLLAALTTVDSTLHRRICLLLVGAIKPDYQQQIDARIAGISPAIQIIRVFEEVKGRRIQAYFEVSDYVLALYQRHVGMASVVIRAAVSGKPLLASDYGYLGRLVQTEQIGLVTDSTSPLAIAQLLQQVLRQGLPYSEVNLEKLADANSNESFARTIFEHL